MNYLDMRTVVTSSVLSNAICAAVISSLWLVNRKRIGGLGYWVACFVLQFFAFVVLALRGGAVPLPVSILLNVPLVVAGAFLLYEGLRQYTGTIGSPRHNYFLLLLFTVAIAIHGYFTFVQPSLLGRNINLDLAVLAISADGAWLMLRRVDREVQPGARLVGLVLTVYCLLSLARIATGLVNPPQPDFFAAGLSDVYAILARQMLLVILTFSLFLMVNRNLLAVSERAAVEYRTLADSGQALIWTSGLDKLCNYFNQTWLRFTGRSIDQELGNGWVEGVHPDDFDQCLQTYVSAFEKREKFSMEYRIRHSSGEYRWIQDDGSPRFDGNGVFLGYIGHCLDISQRRRAEEAVRESEHRLQVLMDNLPGMAYRCLNTPDWPMYFVSRGCLRLTGYLSEELTDRGGTQYGNLIVPEDRDAVFQTVQESVRAGRPFELEYRITHKKGRLIHVWEQGQLVSADGTAEQWLEGLVVDITQRVEAEQAVEKQAEELRERNGELMRLNRAAVGRELRMIELKGEINNFCERLGESPRYGAVSPESLAYAQARVRL